jgi:hypothetical protein
VAVGRVLMSGGLTGAVLISGLAGSPAVLAAGIEPPPGSETEVEVVDEEVDEALGEAQGTGERVEVESARTEWDTLFAEPTGELTLESSVAAVRTRIGAPAGGWRDIDVSLHAIPEGVAPAAPALPLVFSSGGEGPLARIERDGHALELWWQDALPAPVVEGSQATYVNVLPDVDLVVSVFPDGTGFSEVLVVHTPEAAENPALAEFDLGLGTSSGTELVAGDSGGFELLDAAGGQVFVSPPAVMWDSSGGLDSDTAQDGFEIPGGDGLGSAVDVMTERSRQPLEGDRVAEVGTEISDGTISLVPDEEMLSDPGTTYPVFVDPSVSGSRNSWTMLQSAVPNSTAGYKFSGDEGMGRCEVALQSSCNVNNTKRLAWGFGGLGVVRGADVSSATFSAYGAHSYSCTSKSVQVYRTDAIGSSSTWNNKSGWGESRLLTSRSVAHKPSCSNDRWIEWTVTSAAQWAANNSDALYLGLRAANESSMPEGWKRYRYDAKLSITYNHQPNKPTNLRGTSPTMSCTGAVDGRPWVNRDGCRRSRRRSLTRMRLQLLGRPIVGAVVITLFV